jgi:hypothetical protein
MIMRLKCISSLSTTMPLGLCVLPLYYFLGFVENARHSFGIIVSFSLILSHLIVLATCYASSDVGPHAHHSPFLGDDCFDICSSSL